MKEGTIEHRGKERERTVRTQTMRRGAKERKNRKKGTEKCVEF